MKESATDPVCGMSVDPATAPARTDYQGKAYYFCSDDCKAQFLQDRYAKRPAKSAMTA